MLKSLVIGSLALALAACGGGEAAELPKASAAAAGNGGNSDSRGTVRAVVASVLVLPSGTRISATIRDALSSLTNKPGETVQAIVVADVADARGRVVIPSGSSVLLTIHQLEPGSDQVRPEGRLVLNVASVTVRGTTYNIDGRLDPVAHTMKGRGITTDEAARVAGGTAVGAAIGQVIGKNTKSTVIGGAVGAVAGGAVAVRYAFRDIIIASGTPIAITLSQALTVSTRYDSSSAFAFHAASIRDTNP